MQDRPSAIELISAVREFIDDLRERAGGRDQFLLRVSANVLSIVERELQDDEAAVFAEWSRLDTLMGAETKPETFAETKEAVIGRTSRLAQAIRSGDFDDRFDELIDVLTRRAADRLRVSNPAYIKDG